MCSPFMSFSCPLRLTTANWYSWRNALPIAAVSIMSILKLTFTFTTFSLILFLQNLHLTVCLMIASFDVQVYTCAMVYNATPMPKKFITVSMNELVKVSRGSSVMLVCKPHPYAMTTAPSSRACLSVLYPASYWGPFLKTANFSSKFLLMKGRREMIGKSKSDTKLLIKLVNAAARLQPDQLHSYMVVCVGMEPSSLWWEVRTWDRLPLQEHCRSAGNR